MSRTMRDSRTQGQGVQGIRVVIGVAALLLIVAAVVVARTLVYSPPFDPPGARPALGLAIVIDASAAAEHLSQAVRIQTIAHQDPAMDDLRQWDALHAWLATTFPLAHHAMTLTPVGRRSLVYQWRGTDPRLKPIILMAHQDVVPVSPGTERDWTRPPFAGEIAQGIVWGRGTIDDKGSLVALFEAVEHLVAAGFKPTRTIFIVSSDDEEFGGKTGARAAAALLRQLGVRAEFTLDEGQFTLANNPVSGRPAAVIGVAEKGYGTMRVTARAANGHAAMPPADTAIGDICRAVAAIVARPAPLRFRSVGALMTQGLSSYAAFPLRMSVANIWLFEGIITSKMGSQPAAGAMLHTTASPTIIRAGDAENVLPVTASALINFRIAHGDSSEAVMARARAAVSGISGISLAWLRQPDEPSAMSPVRGDTWRRLSALVGQEAGANVVPGLVVAATDSRHFESVSDAVYRYQPVRLSLSNLEMIHGTNERVSVNAFVGMIRFYAALMQSFAGASRPDARPLTNHGSG